MEEIIRQLIELEEQAQAIVKDAEDKKEHFSETIHQDVEKLHQEIARKVQKKDEKISQIELEYAQKQIAMLKEEYANMDNWVQQVYQAVVSAAAKE